MPSYTFYPDADPETSSFDGYVSRGVVGNWATIRAGNGDGGFSNTTSILARVSCTATTDEYTTLARGLIVFLTEGITDTDTIDSATLSLYGKNNNSDRRNQSIGITQCVTASNTNHTSSDYQNNVATTRLCDTDADITGISLAAYTDFTLNATGLSEINVGSGGVSKFCVRFSGDMDNAQPAWFSGWVIGMDFHSADTTGTANDPKLVVNTTAAGGGGTVISGSTGMLLGVG